MGLAVRFQEVGWLTHGLSPLGQVSEPQEQWLCWAHSCPMTDSFIHSSVAKLALVEAGAEDENTWREWMITTT